MGPQQTNDDYIMIMAQLADDNYYNNAQNLVRVKIGDGKDLKYYDLPLMPTDEYPNKDIHYVVVMIRENKLDEVKDAILPDSPYLNMLPGYSAVNQLRSSVTAGYCWLVNRRIKRNVTKYNVGQAGNFNLNANLTSEPENVRYSISPSLNKSYTTTVDEYKGDIDNDNIGIFVTDNSVMLKSGAGSIILGPDGISLLGERTETQTTGTFGAMKRNPIGTMVPTTIVSPFAIEFIPNLDMIVVIGNSVNRVAQYTKAIGTATTAVSNSPLFI